MQNRLIELIVGLFLLVAILVLAFIAFNTASTTGIGGVRGIHVRAGFDDIGSLQPRAAVRVGGVTIGQVDSIVLDQKTFQAEVSMLISGISLPIDSEASIATEGILGAKYVDISPGYSDQMMKNGAVVLKTHSAIILEKLIGELLFNFKK